MSGIRPTGPAAMSALLPLLGNCGRLACDPPHPPFPQWGEGVPPCRNWSPCKPWLYTLPIPNTSAALHCARDTLTPLLTSTRRHHDRVSVGHEADADPA